ncbi:tetratricopeptide repeat protein [Micromonospora chokoriensis]|uniref:Tetratricopeptide repeat-containing protein n=1 Tax=Micromonospora chokoriensis TaxID=356851 RepID=A0A1C4XMM5_9ACTN|nr:tetratricopeptide repeat protein [Micromonospora chokoriensis]SCF09626.1 Tetratricopeptide repeat-containing protein [Micromonospora chokoriensis]
MESILQSWPEWGSWVLLTLGAAVLGAAGTRVSDAAVSGIGQLFGRARVEVYYIPLPVRNILIAEKRQVATIRRTVRRCAGLCILTGMPGIGKSQAAVQYAHRHRRRYQIVWWINASSAEDVVSGFGQLAGAARLVQPDDPRTPVALANDVKTWLEGRRRWLLIFDNARHTDVLLSLMPRRVRTGHIIITSNNPVWDDHQKSVVEAAVPSLQEGSAYLVDRTKNRDLDGARMVASELGCLPLALDQAASYIRVTHIPYRDYLEHLQQSARHLMERSAILSASHYSVIHSLDAAIQGAAAISRDAPAVLGTASYLDNSAVPLQLLREATNLDALRFSEAVAALNRYSLISMARGEDVISVHYLIQTLTRESQPEERGQQLLAALLGVLVRRFPERPWDVTVWPRAAPIFSHMLAASQHGRRLGMRSEEMGDAAHACGRFAWSIGELPVADELFVAASDIYLDASGRDLGRKAAAALNDQAVVLSDYGRPREALRLHARARAISRQLDGPESAVYAWATTGAACALRDLGHPQLAIDLFDESTAIYTAMSPPHPDLWWARSGRAGARADLEDYPAAVAEHSAVLADRRAALGEQHPEVARSHHSVAWAYYGDGRYHDSREAFVSAVRAREMSLGHGHLHTARSWTGLAIAEQALGDSAAAVPLLESAVALQTRMLDDHHLDLAWTRLGLARLAMSREERDSARALLHAASRTAAAAPGRTALLRRDIAAAMGALEGGQLEH